MPRQLARHVLPQVLRFDQPLLQVVLVHLEKLRRVVFVLRIRTVTHLSRRFGILFLGGQLQNLLHWRLPIFLLSGYITSFDNQIGAIDVRDGASQAVVAKFDRAVLVHEYVRRFDVSVQHFAFVEVFDGA